MYEKVPIFPKRDKRQEQKKHLMFLILFLAFRFHFNKANKPLWKSIDAERNPHGFCFTPSLHLIAVSKDKSEQRLL